MARPKKILTQKTIDTGAPLVVISFVGPKFSGKTTASKRAMEISGESGRGVISFATQLKLMAKNLFGLSDAQVYGDQKEVPLSKPIDYITDYQMRQIVRSMKEGVFNLRKFGSSYDFNPAAVSIGKLPRGTYNTPRELMQALGTEIIQQIYKPFSPIMALYPIVKEKGVYFIDDMRFPLEDEIARKLFPNYYAVRIVGRNEDNKDTHASENVWKEIKFFADMDNSGDMTDLDKSLVAVLSKIRQDIVKKGKQ